VILLHDGGGDRSRTVAALGPLLDYLDRRGDQVVPLHQLLGAAREGINPAIPAADPAPERLVAGTGLNAFQLIKDAAWGFLAISTVLLLGRTLFVVALALRRARQERAEGARPATPFAPPVSAVVAAYNEERVIAQTVQAVLDSSYPGELELIVVDDGSVDRTAAIVAEIAERDPRLRLVRQENAGKAAALRRALATARHAFVVTLDADTRFLSDTMLELLQPLRDPGVGAVSGQLRVGNPDSWVARFQATEYMAGFNLDRRAYGVLKAITVVPGAASAYRAAAIAAAGGIQADTLAEDTDLTLALHRAAYQIWHAPRAVAVTEAPRTVRALLRQRRRWSFGTLQCLWKHRDLVFNASHRWLGLFALPSMWFFHIFLVALVPLIDFGLLLALLNGADSAVLGYALAFLGVDLILALVACRLDGAPLATAWRVIPMRFLYRPLLSLAVLDALLRALRGTWMSWGVQERWGLAPAAGGKRPA
jgi:peptidoglycan-N-acetylglucosamine deacetylase